MNNYFSRIHWFVLAFHQQEFRDKFSGLYQSNTHPLPESFRPRDRLLYMALFMAVLVTSLDYTAPSQKQLLMSYGIDSAQLKDKILSILKLRSLDLVALGSLEIVQMCVLLGSYYLYHGEPEMAWPLCGAGLRVAQALNLHRRVPMDGSSDRSVRQAIENRRRAWWAVYEIETFCSMLYGFPLSIADSDCDVEPLNPLDEFSVATPGEQGDAEPTLLFFKGAMSKLSAIVRSALVDLYGIRGHRNAQNLSYDSRVTNLVKKIRVLNLRLLEWDKGLPRKLRLQGSGLDFRQVNRQPDNCEDSPRAFEKHLFKLQALSLKLAFENARILLHRPLLSFKLRCDKASPRTSVPKKAHPFQKAMDTCREAALQMSLVGANSYLGQASETYAIAFVSLHLLTAGVTLCISISSDPLSRESYESRMGIRRLMSAQATLKDKSIIAAQGLGITKRLMSLVMAKEIDAMFDVDTADRTSRATSADVELDPSIDPQQKAVHASQASLPRASVPPAIISPGPEGAAMLGTFSTSSGDQYFNCVENALSNEAWFEYEEGELLLVAFALFSAPTVLTRYTNSDFSN